MDPCSLGEPLHLHNRCILLHVRAHMGLAWWEAFHMDELIASSEQALSEKGLPTVCPLVCDEVA